MSGSNSGLIRHPFKVEIMGSNPIPDTNGFENPLDFQYQLAHTVPINIPGKDGVVGSSPTRPQKWLVAQLVEHVIYSTQ